jgi:hypothetical protein
MRAAAGFLSLAAGLVLCSGIQGGAQQGGAGSADPRVGLKAGFRDAGTAARHMELVASLPKPEGFFDPKAPAGFATPPEQTREQEEALRQLDREHERAGTEAPPRPGANNLNQSNSDLAFRQTQMFIGNFHGFNVYDIENAGKPRQLASVVCPGGQGDVSVHGNLLFMSVEQSRGRLDCGTAGVQAPVSTERFRGIRIFDISDIRKPRQIAAVQTCRGSHTHTLVTSAGDRQNLYVYGSGTGRVRSAQELEGCSALSPEEDSNSALFSIDVIQVPLSAPEKARVVNRPRIFADATTGAIAGLWKGGDHGPGTQRARATNQCHDLTVFPELGLAAGACSGNGILLDISDPVHPVRLDAVVDKSFAYWHSATFNNDGSKVIFTDEWGGGTRPRCRATDPPTWGANAIFDIVDPSTGSGSPRAESRGDRKLHFAGYYKLPVPQTDQENCVAHNGSLVPVPGRDIMVQAWYQGGVSVFDFSDSAAPFEIAFFDRGPLDAGQLITGGHWSTYWYNGHIYASEIARGLDVFKLTPSEHLSQNEINAAMLAYVDEFNPQLQRRVTWPAAPVVAHAYVDQLARSKGIDPQYAAALRTALSRAGQLRTGKEGNAAATLRELDRFAAELESRAASAPVARDAARMRSLSGSMRAVTARLRG